VTIRSCLCMDLLGSTILSGSLLCFGIAACAQTPAQTLSKNLSDSQPPTAATTESHIVSAPDKDYVIGSDDVLAVDVWHENELSKVIPVRPDGKISLPLVGELYVAGLTAWQVQDAIAKHLKEYVEHPQVTVIVQETKSQKFNVVGEVQRPGSFEFGHPVTLLDAIALAGGLRDFAQSKKMYVIRITADGSREKIRINYNDLLKGKPSAQDIVLRSRDTVVVP
jgi:polysaccharide biosynthesis/export protein